MQKLLLNHHKTPFVVSILTLILVCSCQVVSHPEQTISTPLPQPSIMATSAQEPTAPYSIFIIQLKGEADANQQADFLEQVETLLERPVEVLYQYETAYNGMSVLLSKDEASQVSNLPTVQHVQPDFVRQPDEVGLDKN